MSGQTVFADSYRSEDHANHDEEIEATALSMTLLTA
jgi:hypothetical protein